MINGGHVIIYSQDAGANRAFFRDVLDCRYVDAGAGWLIFKLPPSEVAVHPAEGRPGHELYLMCDDLEATMTDLADKGATFNSCHRSPVGASDEAATARRRRGRALRAAASTGHRIVIICRCRRIGGPLHVEPT